MLPHKSYNFILQVIVNHKKEEAEPHHPASSSYFAKDVNDSIVAYVNEHSELSRAQAAANLGIGQSTLSRWLKEARESDDGKINAPGSGNDQSDVAKENARLKRELRDTKDALEILKKAISILGE